MLPAGVTSGSMFHIALHFIVPILVAAVFYRPRWRYAFLVLISTMLVDVDHVLADPMYDPERCSIGFHPLHTTPAIILYALLFAAPLMPKFVKTNERIHSGGWTAHLVGLGLLIHMALDGIDCIS